MPVGASGETRPVTEPTDQPDPAGVPRDLAAALRSEVGLLRAAERRRVFAPRLALGRPGHRGPATVVGGPVAPWQGAPWPPPSWVDAGVRFDVAERLVGSAGTARDEPAHTWFLRPGQPTVHDEDLAWLAAVRHACASHGVVPAGFWVVTRYGWLDPATGESRTWKRLRVDRSG